MMSTFNVNEVAFNLILFKRFGCYQIFSPYSPKIFNYNVYQLVPVVIIIIMFCFLTSFGWIGFFVEMEDTIEHTKILQIVFIYLNFYLSVFKLYICIKNASKIWDLLDVTRINFITSQQCSKYISILYEYRYSSIKISNFVSIFITTTYLTWLLIPLLVNNFFNSKSDGEVTQRFENVNNYRYPISINAYNHYYYLFYFVEMVAGIIITYGILIVDVLLVSISYVFIAHYKVHTEAFANIGHEQNDYIVNENKCNRYHEDFITVVIEQQKVNSKLKLYYSIVWPIIVATVAVTSGSLILLAYSFVMIYMAAEYVPILDIMKLGSAFFFLCIELFTHCYLFEIIQIKKNDVAFGIYCSNWTAMNFKFRKLVLLAMRKNDSNKLLMHFSPKKTVNLQLFADVIMTSYNTVSILLRTQMENNNVSN